MSILVDTGIFVAAADADEPRHADCARVLVEHRRRLVTTAPVVAETAWLIEDRLGPLAEAKFVHMVVNDVSVADLAKRDYRRCEELIRTYADMRARARGRFDRRPRRTADHHDGRHAQPPRLPCRASVALRRS